MRVQGRKGCEGTRGAPGATGARDASHLVKLSVPDFL